MSGERCEGSSLRGGKDNNHERLSSITGTTLGDARP